MGVSLAWDDPPEVTWRTLPQYPLSAFLTKTGGTVLVMFVIDDGGRVSEVEFLESHEPFYEAVEACIKTWRSSLPGRAAAQSGRWPSWP